MKLYKNILFGCAISLGLMSCNDYLDRDNTSGVITPDLTWQNPKAINAVLVNMYDKGIKLDEFDDWYLNKKADLTNPTSLSDEATASYQKDNAFSNRNGTYIYGDQMFRDDMVDRYVYIRNTNSFIANVAKATVLNDTEKELLDAEARFIRAMQYFGMVKRYGGVPILTEPIEYTPGNPSAMEKARNTEAEVYDFIIEECKEIRNILPETRSGSDKYRATKGAAIALWSRAALYAGSIAKYSGTLTLGGTAVAKEYVYIPSSEANHFFTECYDASKELLAMTSVYSLYDKFPAGTAEQKAENFYDLFSKAVNGDNGEYIFQKQYDATSGKGHMWDKLNAPFSYRGDGWGCGMSPVLELVEAFDYIDGSNGKLKIVDGGGNPISYNTPYDLFANKDPRLFGSVYVPGSPCKGTNIEWMRGVIDGSGGSGTKYQAQAQPDQENSATIGGVKYATSGKDGGADTGDASKTGFYQRKFFDETLSDMTNIDAKRSSTPWVVFRLGEIYLNLAEACMELGGKDAEALAAVNKIRERAGIASHATITLDKVRKERRVELAFEKLRYWDLKRWRQAHLDVSQGGLTGFHGTALYPWYNIQSGKYTFETGIPPKQKRIFLEKNYYVKFTADDLSTNSLMVQNPGFGN